MRGLLGEDQLAKGSPAQPVDRLAVCDLDFLRGPEEVSSAPAAGSRRRRWLVLRHGRSHDQRPRRRRDRFMNGAGTGHRSADGGCHRIVLLVRRDGDDPSKLRARAAWRVGL